MNLKEQINPNTILHYIDAEYSTDDNDVDKIDEYELVFGFYDCLYTVRIKSDKEKIENKNFNLSGDQVLFESFDDYVEKDLWGYIMDKIKTYDDWFYNKK